MKSKYLFSTILCFLLCTLCDTLTLSQTSGKGGSTSVAGSFSRGGNGGISFGGVNSYAGRSGGTTASGGTCNVNCIVTSHLPVCSLQNQNCGGNCKRNCVKITDVVCTLLNCSQTTQSLNDLYEDVTYVTPTCTSVVTSDSCQPINTNCFGNVTVKCHKSITKTCNDNSSQVIEENYTKIQNIPVSFEIQTILQEITKSSQNCSVMNLIVDQETKRIITCNNEYVNSILMPQLFWCDPRIDGSIVLLNRTDLYVLVETSTPMPLDHKCGERHRNKIVIVLQGCDDIND